MLPMLLKPKPQTGVIMKARQPDEKPEDSGSDEGLKACARDLIDGVNSNNESMVVSAFKSAFEILDSQPHQEGPHINEDENG